MRTRQMHHPSRGEFSTTILYTDAASRGAVHGRFTRLFLLFLLLLPGGSKQHSLLALSSPLEDGLVGPGFKRIELAFPALALHAQHRDDDVSISMHMCMSVKATQHLPAHTVCCISTACSCPSKTCLVTVTTGSPRLWSRCINVMNVPEKIRNTMNRTATACFISMTPSALDTFSRRS